jgi:hypothetical protein
MRRPAKALAAAALIIVAMLTSGASGCEDDCPTPRNKGVCING